MLPDFGLEPQDRTPLAEDRELLLEIAASCNDARFGAEGQLIGDPTETALIVAAERLQRDNTRPHRIGEVPFDSERKRMTTVHRIDGERVAYMKGGTDVVLSLCTRARLRGEVVEMTEELRSTSARIERRLAAGGFRTLAFAFRDLDSSRRPMRARSSSAT